MRLQSRMAFSQSTCCSSIQPSTPSVQRAAGISGPYSSKMDDFEDFICHAKLSTLPLQLSQAPAAPMKGKMTAAVSNNAVATDRQSVSQTAPQGGTAMRKLLLIEDMPHYTDLHQRQRLANLLGEFMVTGCSLVMQRSTACQVLHAQPCCRREPP